MKTYYGKDSERIEIGSRVNCSVYPGWWMVAEINDESGRYPIFLHWVNASGTVDPTFGKWVSENSISKWFDNL